MRVVVCGYSRGGTTLLYNMLRTTVRGFEFFDRERPAGYGTPPCVTKRPLDVFRAAEIVDNWPDTKFITVIRDPRGLVCSKHWNVPDDWFIGWDAQYFAPMGGPKKRTNPGILQIAEAIRRIPDRIEIYYEALVREPNKVQADLGGIFEFDGFMQDFWRHETPDRLRKPLNGLGPPDPSRIDAWKHHPERVKQQFTECPALFDLLKEYGYETDDRWFDY